MAIAIDTTDAFSSGLLGESHAFTVGAGSDRVLYVLIGARYQTKVTNVTWNGVALTRVAQTDASANIVQAEAWRLVNPDTGAHQVAVTVPDWRTAGIVIFSLNGVHQSVPETSGLLSAQQGNISQAIGSAAGDLVVGLATAMNDTPNTTTLTATSGQTVDGTVTVTGTVGVLLKGAHAAGAASVSMDWTLGGASPPLNYDCQVLVAVKPTGGAPPPATAPSRLLLGVGV